MLGYIGVGIVAIVTSGAAIEVILKVQHAFAALPF